MEPEEHNLNQYISSLLSSQPPPLKLIPTLKFKNQLYRQGDHVLLLHHSQQKDQELVARIVCIAEVPRWQFPVLLVAWYFNREQSLLELRGEYFSPRQLILSHYVDWQFMEALRGKAQVLSQEDFRHLEHREREGVYFCTSWLSGNPQRVRYCHCLKGNTSDPNLEICFGCGTEHHSSCSGTRQTCLNCRSS